MPNYRRLWYPGGAYFFTVNLLQRHDNDLLTRHADLLRAVPRIRSIFRNYGGEGRKVQ